MPSDSGLVSPADPLEAMKSAVRDWIEARPLAERGALALRLAAHMVEVAAYELARSHGPGPGQTVPLLSWAADMVRLSASLEPGSGGPGSPPEGPPPDETLH